MSFDGYLHNRPIYNAQHINLIPTPPPSADNPPAILRLILDTLIRLLTHANRVPLVRSNSNIENPGVVVILPLAKPGLGPVLIVSKGEFLCCPTRAAVLDCVPI